MHQEGTSGPSSFFPVNLPVVAESLSHVQLFATTWIVARQAPGINKARILEWVAISLYKFTSNNSTILFKNIHYIAFILRVGSLDFCFQYVF